MLTAVPLFALELGGQESEVGLVLGVFALAAMCLRPVAGRELDRRGRVPILVLGSAIFALCSAGYALVGSIAALLVLRALHGTGMAFSATGAPVLAGDLAPPGRRGEAIGLQGSAQNVASALGPPLGAALALGLGYQRLFIVAALLAAVGALLANRVREPARQVRTEPPRWFHEAGSGPGLLILGLSFGYGAISSFIPLYAIRNGLENPGLYFLVYALAMVAGQTVGGRLSDRVGRKAVVVPGLVVAAAGIALVPALSGMGLFLSALVTGVGQGAAQPTVFALAVDRVGPSERGSVLGTVGTFLELGIATGSILAGVAAQAFGLGPAFLLVALAPLLSGVVGLLQRPVPAR